MKSNMLEDRLWSVEIGQGMGPFLLGLPRSEGTAIVRLLGFKIDSTQEENDAILYVEEMHATLVFSAQSPQTLERIDVCDWRIRFGSLRHRMLDDTGTRIPVLFYNAVSMVFSE
jgi:hypothetical protein